jgi:hypothetical protein
MQGMPQKLELGCGTAPTPGYMHHDRRRHSPHIEVVHDLDMLPWPWADASHTEILGLDVFEHLHLMPGGLLRLRVPIFGSPWHLIDPTHVRGFHPLNFDYFIRGKELWQKYGHFYFDFAFAAGSVTIEGHNILATLAK